MDFNKTISCIQQSAKTQKIIHRTAVRAILIENDEILMVRSRLGYYKLPGGGLEKGETLETALLREVTEETGYTDCRIIRELGIVSEHRPDQAVADCNFHMDSFYFLCELPTKDKTMPSLVGYELEEEYTAVWVSVQQAIESNTAVTEKEGSKPFLQRENFVLEWLQENL